MASVNNAAMTSVIWTINLTSSLIMLSQHLKKKKTEPKLEIAKRSISPKTGDFPSALLVNSEHVAEERSYCCDIISWVDIFALLNPEYIIGK